MTMDGAIVADFITTGVLNGALIKTGSIQAGSLFHKNIKILLQEKITGAEIV